MRITGPMWFAAALSVAVLSLAAQCALAWWAERRAQARHAERLAAYRDLSDTVLRDSITGLGQVAATLQDGYRTLERTRTAILTAGRAIGATDTGATPPEEP